MKRHSVLTGLLTGTIACLTAFGYCASRSAVDGSAATPAVTITVSAAASLQDVLEALTPQFIATHPEIAAHYNFGSSGSLQRQIEQGAPVDVFFSASAEQMEALDDQGLILSTTRRDVVGNHLVAIAPLDSTLEASDLTQLKTAAIDHIAVGEFRSVPAGRYAEQVFATLNLLEPLQSKFAFGNNVRGVLSAVESGNADLGVVYATDAALSDRVKIVATAPAESHQPIRYPVAAIASSVQPEAARAFIAFLQTNVARETFTAFGFAPVPSDD
ncbi:molybdate ABC transporter substrate-binding protein [Rubidibacter lacunae]|nr:molybdate ABC transporter substrate-binding protein [Rubidibacter lacunae]